MFKNYFTIAWRNLVKQKTFTLLNLGGLTISLAACMIIYFWVTDELNYDKSAKNADRVYRVGLTLQVKGQPDKQFAVTAAPLVPRLVKDFPEIEKGLRVRTYGALVGFENQHLFSDKIILADSSFFEVFGYPLLKGDPHTVLTGTHSVVLTETAAKRYFGNNDPIGKLITCDDTAVLKVTGVAKDLPATNHFKMDLVCSMRAVETPYFDNNETWWNDSYYSYLLLRNPRDAAALDKKLTRIMDKYNGEQNKAYGLDGLHFLQALPDIHLKSNLSSEINPPGNMMAIRIFIAISIFLLLVACINYINLSTATAFRRAKEIGVRKVVGAALGQLIAQFLGESLLLALGALLLALGLTQIILPLFNKMAGTDISLLAHLSWRLISLFVAFAIGLGLVAGIYPAFHLSGINPIRAFRNMNGKKGELIVLRRGLVVFQFTLSVILIVATIVALQQLRFMQGQDLGLNKEQVIALPLRNGAQALAANELKQSIKSLAGVAGVSNSSSTPGKHLSNIVTLPEGVPDNQTQSMNTLVVDFDFISTYQLKLAAGRGFQADMPTDSTAYILNETAVREIGWGKPENAIGKNFNWGLGKKGKVIGVLKDFHFNSLRTKVVPVVMHVMPLASQWYGYISARVNSRDANNVIAQLEAKWKSVLPNQPFDYFFVDEDYNKQYETEQRLSRISVLFAALTIFISCLGLFGLVMVAVAQRTKEVGIRKVLGASVAGITALLSRDFLKLVGIAILIGSPIAWWLMNMWLRDFPYRIQIQWWVFGVAALLAVFIALATVSMRSIRAALANPVSSLRSE